MALKRSKAQRAKRIAHSTKGNRQRGKDAMRFALCALLLFVWGCASLLQKQNILAVVDSEPITEEDLKYSLEIAHRREDLSSARVLNISDYVQKLIDNRLIIQEAGRMGMEEYPGVQQAVHAYILRESVMRLHDEEIVQKVSVTEEDIISYYRKNYEQFSLCIIELSSEEDAAGILEQLKKGEDFTELARKYSTHSSKKDGGEVVLTRKSMGLPIEKAVSSLKPGELSDVIGTRNRYYIVKLISRQETPDEGLERVRGSIERAIRKQKEEDRSDEYLKLLREQALIKINQELLSAIRLDEGEDEREKWLKDKRPLVEINDSTLTVGDFTAMVPPRVREINEEILNNWIDRKLVDQEALSRRYEIKSDLKNMVYRYKNQLLKNTFIKKVIMPRIDMSDKAVEDYYLTHQKSFLKPVRFKIQQITVKTLDDAQEVLNNLKDGADFSWLANRRSTDSAAPKGGAMGWLTREQLPEQARKIADTLKPGDISPIIEIDSLYRIILLQGKTKEEAGKLDKVKTAVRRAYFYEQFNDLYNRYVARLKEEAQITIYDKAIQPLEERLKR